MYSFSDHPEPGSILYNITIKVNAAIEEDWLEWLLDIHIPEILGTGCFQKHQVVKLLGEDQEGATYAIQLYARSMEKYEYYISNYEKTLYKESRIRWGQQFVSFGTIMKIVN